MDVMMGLARNFDARRRVVRPSHSRIMSTVSTKTTTSKTPHKSRLSIRFPTRKSFSDWRKKTKVDVSVDDTTKLIDLAVALNQLQQTSIPFRNVTRTIKNRVTSSTTSSTTSTIRPFYTTNFPQFFVVTKASQPFKRTDRTRPRTTSNYDYYDDLPQYSKVLIDTYGNIRCLDQGNFPHPSSCKRFIFCAKIDSGDTVGWEYTCPKKLSFDPVGGMCNWSFELGCDET
ncbi:hypothetical protein FQR65_LT11105 [Abscondita terminalis]|nr:hypothetical protein FQR65_LT11105 [Abscondita terminalis]